ncbi:hypothetical protein D9615_010020 [Tricholomella constricta]|uniref:DUF7223 domain-containing protein n=1 Tax=Tricholomella constricta TaxID=117010 RepID=A0A8H5GTK1_9AGAR|nr:hypothetical protein D9615_010020 [Tricholomella constricta]
MMALSLSSFSTIIPILLLLPFITHAARLNDWSKPCFQGECFYDLPASDGHASGSLKIWGSPDAITDITAAAGWTILGCSPDALAQDIRLVCDSDDTGSSGCNHLYQSVGAVGKIVRLPESCGKSAFARISKAWVPEDQSIPKDIARRLVRRQGVQPRVQALALDTNFAAVDPATNGEVSIAIQGSTVPGAEGNLTVTPPSSRRRRSGHDRRAFSSFIQDAFDRFNSFDQSATKALSPVEVSKSFPIFSKSLACAGPPAFDASIKADVDTNARAVITLGVAAAGTIVPPKLTDFGLFAGMDASLEGTLNLKGNVAAKADSGQLTFFQAGIPGLDFPGVLTIGPTFKILGQATATLDVDVDMEVDLSYTVNGAKLFFPPSPNNPSGGSFSPGTAPLKLSVSPLIASKAVVAAHLIPRLDIGVSALGGSAEATVSLDLDTSATVTMNLNAAAAAGVALESTTGAASNSASASVDGCVKANAALNVNAGADGSFFGLFDRSTKVPLFGKDFEVFQKCFGAQKRAVIPLSKRTGPNRHPKLIYHRRALSVSCPVASVNALVAVA